MPPPFEILDSVCQSIIEVWPAEQWRDFDIVVAVSGGPDSVALLHSLAHLQRIQQGRGRLIAAYCHHATRHENDLELDFVQQLANKLDCQFQTVKRTEASQSPQSEESLREFRYQSLREIAAQTGARFIATGHTNDDQIETILFRILRGTGIRGLMGIPFSRVDGNVTIVRPLLHVSRQQIVRLLNEIDEKPLEDPSNRSVRFTRNFIRWELLPRIREKFPAPKNAILRLGQQAQEVEYFFDEIVNDLCETVVDHLGTQQVHLNCADLSDQPPVVVKRLFAHLWQQSGWPMGSMDADNWTLLVDMTRSTASAAPQITLPGNIAASRSGQRLVLTKRDHDSNPR